jgi:hypothetical protein
MLILRLLTLHTHQARALHYLPPRFDELIILPLPFMGELIVEAYRENPSAARETIDYLIHVHQPAKRCCSSNSWYCCR